MVRRMPPSIRLVAILNVVAWGGFWAFGYLALSARPEEGTRTAIAALLAAIGGGVGLWAFNLLRRAAQESGYERPYVRAPHRDTTNGDGEQTT